MKRYSLVLYFIIGGVVTARAQYDQRPDYEPSEYRSIYVGALQREFKSRYTNPLPDSARINFNRVMPVIGFRQGLFDVMFGYTRYTLQGVDKTAIFAALTISRDFPVAVGSSGSLVIPAVLATDLTQADGIGGERETFNIASVGIGAGLKYRYYSEGLDFSIMASEVLHYSIEGINTGSGFSAASLAEAILVLKDVLVLDGIMLGYRFRYQTWSMNDEKFDYKSLSHGPFVGVLF